CINVPFNKLPLLKIPNFSFELRIAFRSPPTHRPFFSAFPLVCSLPCFPLFVLIFSLSSFFIFLSSIPFILSSTAQHHLLAVTIVDDTAPPPHLSFAFSFSLPFFFFFSFMLFSYLFRAIVAPLVKK
ncbi:hypothetical protein Pfo_019316, partial [Paulownia fortunei]